MDDLVERLEALARAEHDDLSVASEAASRIKELEEEVERFKYPHPQSLRAENERLKDLVRTLLENDPYDMAADAVTVLDVWRKEARAALKGEPHED